VVGAAIPWETCLGLLSGAQCFLSALIFDFGRFDCYTDCGAHSWRHRGLCVLLSVLQVTAEKERKRCQ
jgi:hypothetical protein